MSEIVTVSAEELSLVDNNSLNQKQLQILLSTTPKKYVKERPAKGGGKWSYVSGGYVRKVLNLMFGWDWDFEIIDERIEHGEAIVKGRLTCRIGDRKITKMQYGNKEVMCKKSDGKPLSIGNDLKAAATDALKKCATELGIANDVYNPSEFTPVNVDDGEDYSLERLKELIDEKKGKIDEGTRVRIDEIVANEESNSYKKAIKTMEKL